MKRFFEHYMQVQTVLIENDSVKDWQSYVNRIPMLKTGIDIIEKILSIGKDIGMDNPLAYIVGGTIRDIITGDKEPDDIDIATNVPIDELEKHFKTHDIGANKDFGIIVVQQDGENFEIANFRADGQYSDGRRPDDVEIVMDFEKDAERRDFTINAMGVDKDGNIIDYFDGKGDIKNKIVKTVGDPEKRFQEDYLRMWRAVRFASRMGFQIDKATMDAIKSNSEKTRGLAVERIYKEIKKMAGQSGSKFADAIETLIDTGLLQYILPEIIQMDDFEHSVEHHPEGNVLQHTLAALRSNDSADAIVNLATLLHDIGKIKSHTISDKGTHQYLDHAKKADGLIDDIASRLKIDNKTKEALLYAAMNHMKMHDFLKLKPKTAMDLLNSPHWDVLFSVAKADVMARGELFDADEWAKIEDRVEKLKERFKGKQAIDNIRKVVNGNLVMKVRPEIKPSREMGEIIKKTVEWIINDGINIDDMDKIVDFIKNA